TWQAAMEALEPSEAAGYFSYARSYLLDFLAGIVQMTGDYRHAVEWRRLALQNLPSEGRADFSLDELLQQGEALQRCGCYSEARIPLETARLLALTIRERRYEGRALIQQTHLALALGLIEEARACSVMASEAAGQSGDPTAQVQATLA